jgi:hypothetical protein
MPYEGVGARHTAICTKECQHGAIVTEDGFVGSAFKVTQPDRFTRPSAYPTIAVEEEFEIQLGGVHEANLSGGIATADIGDKVFIDPADNTLSMAKGLSANEVQTVTITGVPTGGSFTLTFDGATTAAIAFDAAASLVQTRLEALSSIDVGDVVVTGSAGGPYTVTFGGGLDEQNVPAMTKDAALLTGGTAPNVTIATPTPGSAGRLPVGVITEIDTVRTPDVARINSNNWQAFLPGA